VRACVRASGRPGRASERPSPVRASGHDIKRARLTFLAPIGSARIAHEKRESCQAAGESSWPAELLGFCCAGGCLPVCLQVASGETPASITKLGRRLGSEGRKVAKLFQPTSGIILLLLHIGAYLALIKPTCPSKHQIQPPSPSSNRNGQLLAQ